MNTNKTSNDDQDLQKHGVKPITPEQDEYYTLDLKRGDDTDVNNLPDIDVAGADPLNESNNNMGNIIENHSDLQPKTSNEGGVVQENDSVNENKVSGAVAGEPGHWGIDEDTD